MTQTPGNPPKTEKKPHDLEYFRSKLSKEKQAAIEAITAILQGKPRGHKIAPLIPILDRYYGRLRFIQQNFTEDGTPIEPAPTTKRPEWKRRWPQAGEHTFEEQKTRYNDLKQSVVDTLKETLESPDSLPIVYASRTALARFIEFRYVFKRQWTDNGKWRGWFRAEPLTDTIQE